MLLDTRQAKPSKDKQDGMGWDGTYRGRERTCMHIYTNKVTSYTVPCPAHVPSLPTIYTTIHPSIHTTYIHTVPSLPNATISISVSPLLPTTTRWGHAHVPSLASREGILSRYGMVYVYEHPRLAGPALTQISVLTCAQAGRPDPKGLSAPQICLRSMKLWRYTQTKTHRVTQNIHSYQTTSHLCPLYLYIPCVSIILVSLPCLA